MARYHLCDEEAIWHWRVSSSEVLVHQLSTKTVNLDRQGAGARIRHTAKDNPKSSCGGNAIPRKRIGRGKISGIAPSAPAGLGSPSPRATPWVASPGRTRGIGPTGQTLLDRLGRGLAEPSPFPRALPVGWANDRAVGPHNHGQETLSRRNARRRRAPLALPLQEAGGFPGRRLPTVWQKERVPATARAEPVAHGGVGPGVNLCTARFVVPLRTLTACSFSPDLAGLCYRRWHRNARCTAISPDWMEDRYERSTRRTVR